MRKPGLDHEEECRDGGAAPRTKVVPGCRDIRGSFDFPLRLAAHLQLAARVRAVPLVTVRFSPEESVVGFDGVCGTGVLGAGVGTTGLPQARSVLEPAAAAAN